MSYLLLTLARNEENYLPAVVECVLGQLCLPSLWLIVNDGSTDNTQLIIDGLLSKYDWIIGVQLPVGQGGLGLHFAQIAKEGFAQLQKWAAVRNINYEFIGKVDADVVFGPECFAALMQEFYNDKTLGIASSILLQEEPNTPSEGQQDYTFADYPTDGVRLYRRECFEEIGGISVVKAPEVVAGVKARIRGWRLKRVNSIIAYHRRKSHQETSLWKRWEMRGAEQHYLGYPFLIVLGSCFYDLLFIKPIFLSLAHFWGYIKAVIVREDQITDQEVKQYFRSIYSKEIVFRIVNLYKNLRKNENTNYS